MQKEFLETLASDEPKKGADRHRKKPPIANGFALGYTYQDVFDADHEDILARLSIYMTSDSSPEFGSVLKPLFTPQTIPEALVVILLDWNEPWSWISQLRKWIAMIQSLTNSMDRESDEVAEQVMKDWQQRRRGGTKYEVGGPAGTNDANVTLPLGEGEWDIPLGLPLAVVCHKAEKIPSLEIDHHWKEEDFDFVLQSLRTVLLKHGASLIYTSKSSPNSLPTLIHSSLDIHSSLKKQTLKHNVIDRDKILIPPNWDSFGKIRVLREGFDVEKISRLWTNDLESEAKQSTTGSAIPNNTGIVPPDSVLNIYESTITDPRRNRQRQTNGGAKSGIEVSVPSHQSFLTQQSETIERLKAEETTSITNNNNKNTAHLSTPTSSSIDRMNDQIGPVQVNMGGIQVDPNDVIRRLKFGREGSNTNNSRPSSSTAGVGSAEGDHQPGTPGGGGGTISTSASAMATPEREMKAQNEALNTFFAGLMKRGAGGGNSPRNTPGQEGKRGGTPREKNREREGERDRERERERE